MMGELTKIAMGTALLLVTLLLGATLVLEHENWQPRRVAGVRTKVAKLQSHIQGDSAERVHARLPDGLPSQGDPGLIKK